MMIVEPWQQQGAAGVDTVRVRRLAGEVRSAGGDGAVAASVCGGGKPDGDRRAVPLCRIGDQGTDGFTSR